MLDGLGSEHSPVVVLCKREERRVDIVTGAVSPCVGKQRDEFLDLCAGFPSSIVPLFGHCFCAGLP